jgi:NTP pyrophosphatase (non-canonical NTP hydrolase)
MSDVFSDMYNLQKKFQDDLLAIKPKASCNPEGLTDEEIETKFKDMMLLLIKECTEVLDEINFKPHVTKRKTIDKELLLEELIDVFKFWMNLCILYGFEPADLHRMFNIKSAEVERRSKNGRD